MSELREDEISSLSLFMTELQIDQDIELEPIILKEYLRTEFDNEN